MYSQPEKAEFLALKKEIFDEVTAKMIPDDVISRVDIRDLLDRVGLLTFFIVYDPYDGRA